jgi:hypothetical protein
MSLVAAVCLVCYRAVGADYLGHTPAAWTQCTATPAPCCLTPLSPLRIEHDHDYGQLAPLRMAVVAVSLSTHQTQLGG